MKIQVRFLHMYPDTYKFGMQMLYWQHLLTKSENFDLVFQCKARLYGFNVRYS